MAKTGTGERGSSSRMLVLLCEVPSHWKNPERSGQKQSVLPSFEEI